MANFPLSGAVAALTGAGHGIGRSLALRLARDGCHLALSDVDADAVAATALDARALGVEASARTVDVSDAASVASWADDALAEHGRVSLLVCNAGVALAGTVDEVSLDDIAWLMSINFWGVVHAVKAFLPILRRERVARVVTMSSIFGIVAPPGHAAYAASKFAVRGFSEALRHELHDSAVGVTIVHPGGVSTDIARRARFGAGADDSQRERGAARFARLARTTPDAAADIVARGISRGDPRILVGADANQMALAQRLLPVRYWSLIGREVSRRTGGTDRV